MSDAIEVDVNRSFNNLKQIQAENLNNILKTYATVNHSLDYCQGMNFIAGFLFLVYGRESLAYAVLKELIPRFQLACLFNTELPMLKLHFYQLDRLVAILLPDLHQHLKEETVNASYYSSSYFITLFTQVLQNQSSGSHCARLLRVWDYFLVTGWKGVFKAAVLMLKEHEEQLTGMGMEKMLGWIAGMPVRFMVREHKDEDEEREAMAAFDKQMHAIKIPTMLLERLKKEFD